ncbi:MAG: hypothetical protein ACK41E_02395 [Deinococcales bacterium]
MIHFPESTSELQAKMTIPLDELANECRQYLEYFAAYETAANETKEDAEIQLASTIEHRQRPN